MDFNATKLFIAVVNAGSFSAASERTSVPIATLSRKINELEQELKVQLLERSRQGVKPTYKGQQFFEQARLGVELLEDAHKSVTAAHSLQGKLRLSIPPNFSLWWDLLNFSNVTLISQCSVIPAKGSLICSATVLMWRSGLAT